MFSGNSNQPKDTRTESEEITDQVIEQYRGILVSVLNDYEPDPQDPDSRLPMPKEEIIARFDSEVCDKFREEMAALDECESQPETSYKSPRP